MKNYIPGSKDDPEAISNLKNRSFEEVKQDIPTLLEWIQDLHWDVAHDICDWLIPHINKITNELLYIINTNDEEWKFNILIRLIAKSPHQLAPELLSVIKKIAENPTHREALEEVNIVAKKIIIENDKKL